MATSVWAGPAKNAWITSVMSIISRNMQIPPPPDGAPSIFRCAKPGLIKGIMEKSGFKNVKEKEVNGKVLLADFEYFWDMMNEVAAPVVVALSTADDAMKEKIKNEVKDTVTPYLTSKGLELDYGALIISGEK